MCKHYPGSFYDPPESDPCDEVLKVLDTITERDGTPVDEPTEKQWEEAEQSVHGNDDGPDPDDYEEE